MKKISSNSFFRCCSQISKNHRLTYSDNVSISLNYVESSLLKLLKCTFTAWKLSLHNTYGFLCSFFPQRKFNDLCTGKHDIFAWFRAQNPLYIVQLVSSFYGMSNISKPNEMCHVFWCFFQVINCIIIGSCRISIVNTVYTIQDSSLIITWLHEHRQSQNIRLWA